MNRSPYVIFHGDTWKDIQKWFKDNPHAIYPYYEVTSAFYHENNYMPKD